MKSKSYLRLALGVSVLLYILSEVIHTTWAGYIGLLGFLSTAIVVIIWIASSGLNKIGRYSWAAPGMVSLIISYAWYVLAEPSLLLALHSSTNYASSSFMGDVQTRLGQMLLPSIITTVITILLVRNFHNRKHTDTTAVNS